MRPPLSPSQHSAFPMAGLHCDKDPAAAHGFAKAAVSQSLLLSCSSILGSAAGPVSHCCCCAPALFSWSLFSAAPEVPPAALAGGKRRFPRASLAALLTWKRLSPLALLHPGLLSLSSSSSPWISGNKANLVSHLSHRRGSGGAGALLPLALLFNFLFPNQTWPKQRDGEFST